MHSGRRLSLSTPVGESLTLGDVLADREREGADAVNGEDDGTDAGDGVDLEEVRERLWTENLRLHAAADLKRREFEHLSAAAEIGRIELAEATAAARRSDREIEEYGPSVEWRKALFARCSEQQVQILWATWHRKEIHEDTRDRAIADFLGLGPNGRAQVASQRSRIAEKIEMLNAEGQRAAS